VTRRNRAWYASQRAFGTTGDVLAHYLRGLALRQIETEKPLAINGFFQFLRPTV
jgi:hypothetical protein